MKGSSLLIILTEFVIVSRPDFIAKRVGNSNIADDNMEIIMGIEKAISFF